MFLVKCAVCTHLYVYPGACTCPLCPESIGNHFEMLQWDHILFSLTCVLGSAEPKERQFYFECYDTTPYIYVV